MRFGVHLPLMDFGGNPYTAAHLREYTERSARLGSATLAANDHLVFGVPWLDGPIALASVIGESEPMTLATSVALPVVRGPVALAKAMAAIDRLSDGRLIVAVGPGSSEKDYAAAGLDFAERWVRLDESIAVLRSLWDPSVEPFEGRFYSSAGIQLAPTPVSPSGPPIWVGSWGSPAGLRRTARLGDGWLASAYNTTPAAFAESWTMLRALLAERRRDVDAFPNALATMWFHISDSRSEADEVFRSRLLPAVNRPEAVLRERLPFGSAEAFAEKLVAFAEAGLQQVIVWPVTDEVRQLELFRERVWPLVSEGSQPRSR
ncbi:MAG TPA: LLM class flavin-dependent oxidoreductase [Acidimicrobiales bacterium]